MIPFIQEPESQNVAIGETAEFECRHPTADYIGLKVNDSSILSNVSFMNISTASYSNTSQDKSNEENLHAVLKLALDKDGAQYRLRMTLKKLKEKYGM